MLQISHQSPLCVYFHHGKPLAVLVANLIFIESRLYTMFYFPYVCIQLHQILQLILKLFLFLFSICFIITIIIRATDLSNSKGIAYFGN